MQRHSPTMRRPTGPLPSTGLPRSSSSSAASLSPLASLICRSLEWYRMRRACSSRSNSYLEAKVANAFVTAGGVMIEGRAMMIEGRAAPPGGGADVAAPRKEGPILQLSSTTRRNTQSNTLSKPACVDVSWPHGPELRPIPTQCARTGRPDVWGRAGQVCFLVKDGPRPGGHISHDAPRCATCAV